MRNFIFLAVFALSIGACSKNHPISSGPYQALKCSLTNGIESPSQFIFNKNNGKLYYFDLLTDQFKPLTRRVEEGLYFASMQEFSSRLETSRLALLKAIFGTKLVITQIEYYENDASNKNVVKHIIHLRSLVMNRVYQDLDGKHLRVKEYCVWIDPKLS